MAARIVKLQASIRYRLQPAVGVPEEDLLDA